MMTINLEKKLVAGKDKAYTKREQLVLDEDAAITATNDEENIKILEEMRLGHIVSEAQTIRARLKSIQGLDPSRVFKREDIKKLCMSYRLKFLPIDHYRGSIDPELPTKVKEFKKQFGDNFRYDNFSVCAPADSFQLQDHPVDPLLFYWLGDGMYYLVHKWGNDISPLRWFKALKFRNYWSWFWINTLQYWVPAALVSAFVFRWHWALSFAYLGGALINFLFARYWEGSYSRGWLERKTTAENWDNERYM
jgi:hypothetical protein